MELPNLYRINEELAEKTFAQTKLPEIHKAGFIEGWICCISMLVTPYYIPKDALSLRSECVQDTQ